MAWHTCTHCGHDGTRVHSYTLNRGWLTARVTADDTGLHVLAPGGPSLEPLGWRSTDSEVLGRLLVCDACGADAPIPGRPPSEMARADLPQGTFAVHCSDADLARLRRITALPTLAFDPAETPAWFVALGAVTAGETVDFRYEEITVERTVPSSEFGPNPPGEDDDEWQEFVDQSVVDSAMLIWTPVQGPGERGTISATWERE